MAFPQQHSKKSKLKIGNENRYKSCDVLRLNFSDFVTTCFEKMVDFSNKSATLDKIVYNKTKIKLHISLKFKLIKR